MTGGTKLSSSKTRLQAVETSTSYISTGGEVCTCWIKPTGDGFHIRVMVYDPFIARIGERLVGEAGAQPVKTSQDTAEYTLNAAVKDQFAALEIVEELLPFSAATHAMHIYETANGADRDPFAIMPNVRDATVIQTGNPDSDEVERFKQALRESGLCSSVFISRDEDLEVELTPEAEADLPATYLAIATIYNKVTGWE